MSLHPKLGCCFCGAVLILTAQPLFADKLNPQVELKTTFVTIDHRAVQELGLNMTAELAKLSPAESNVTSPNAGNLGLGPNPSVDTVGARLFPNNSAPNQLDLSGVLTGPQFQIILNGLSDRSGVNVLSGPIVVTPSDEAAKIDIEAASGVRLEVKPRISADRRYVGLELVPQATGFNLPPLGDGDTIILGGFLQKADKPPPSPPTIGKLPIIGQMPRKRDDVKTDLILFITPHIVSELEPSSGGYESGEPVKTETVGTGNTIGHVADLKFQNMTTGPLLFYVPPLILESQSGRNQAVGSFDYLRVNLGANETKIVPLDGVCLERNKPAVRAGLLGELILNTGGPGGLRRRFDRYGVRTALRELRAQRRAALRMQRAGLFQDFPYKDRDKQIQILMQWATWKNPRIAQLVDAPAATKDDLRQVVYDQLQDKGALTADTKEKVDRGIDTIANTIESVSAEADKMEEPASYGQTEMPAGTFEIADQSDQTPIPWSGPLPETKEKAKKEKKKKKWPKPIQDWLDKQEAADYAEAQKKDAQADHNDAKKKFFDQSKHHGELEKARDEAKQKADAPGATQQDKDNYKNAQGELDKNEKDLEKEFNKTPEGKKAFDKFKDAEKKAQQAGDAAKDAEKKLPPGVDKDEIKKAEAEAKKALTPPKPPPPPP